MTECGFMNQHYAFYKRIYINIFPILSHTKAYSTIRFIEFAQTCAYESNDKHIQSVPKNAREIAKKIT